MIPHILMDDRAGNVDQVRRSGGWSPGNMLEDTVARMQRDLADIQAKHRFLRTPGVQPVVPTPWQAAFTTTKVPWFGGTTSWEHSAIVLDAIVLSNGWDDATAALQLLSHLQGDTLHMGIVGTDVSSDIQKGPGRRVVGTLWIAGQTDELQTTI